MRKVYRFHWDCGRNGDLTGVFVADEEEIQASIGRHVYFGEVLGKHSEIYGDLGADDFQELTDDQDFIEKAEKFRLVPTGFNPIWELGFSDPDWFKDWKAEREKGEEQ